MRRAALPSAGVAAQAGAVRGRTAWRGGIAPALHWLHNPCMAAWLRKPAPLAELPASAACQPVAACAVHNLRPLLPAAAAGYDLAFMWDQPDPAEIAWQQFLGMGLQEGRPHRFIC
jgi:hypothetical protein